MKPVQRRRRAPRRPPRDGRRLAPAAAAVALLAALAAGCAGAEAVSTGEPLLVAAASDLAPAFTELGERFTQETGLPVTFSFGSSGQLAQQVVEGAPFDLFASADGSFVDRVLAAGRGDPGTRATYASGRLVLWSRDDTWGGWADLGDAVADGDVRALAIANPEHAPYGRAARQALETLGLWAQAEPRLVFGENISDTQRLAASGNADAAVLALSLALASDEAGQGRWRLLPAELHAPLRQDLVVVASAAARAEVAADFAGFVTGAHGREVMRRFGFLLPGEDPPASWEGG